MQKRLLKIGVDARLLSESITGIGRYLLEVLSRMVDEGHEWYLYSHRPIIIGDWNKKNVFIRSLNLKGRPIRMIWAQSVLPYWANKDKVDIFWSPSHRIPRFLPSNISSVVTIHDLVWRYAGETMRPLSRWLDSKLMMWATSRADLIIAVSDSTAKDLIREDQQLVKKINVIVQGISPHLSDTINSPEQGAVKFNFPYYLFVGTLEPRKNLNRLIEALSILPNDVKKSAKLVIVGGKGWGGVNVDNLIQLYGVQDNVIQLGYVDDSTLVGLYSNALFLVMPSLYEGFGLPLAEAMSHGVPALTSNRSSMPEVIGNAGILVNPEHVQSISDGLFLLLTDHKLRHSLSNLAKNRATHFNWSRCSKETLNVLITANKNPR